MITETYYGPGLLSKMKLLVMDVDGTLTDGGVYYSETGIAFKRFNVHDGMGISLLHNAGVKTMILTSDISQIPVSRAVKLNIQHCIIGSEHKLTDLKKVIAELGIQPWEVCYIGDDVNDLECMRFCRVSACPANAVDVVKDGVDIVLEKRGGEGAVRELCDMIIEDINHRKYNNTVLGILNSMKL